MAYRSLAAVIVAAAILPAAVGAQAADPPAKPPLPRTPCAKRFTDVSGDGYSNPTGSPGANVQKTPGLDIVGAYLRTTADQVQVFVEVDDIPVQANMPAYDLGYRYTVTFKYNAKAFKFGHIWYNAQAQSASLFGGKNWPEAEPTMTGVVGWVDPATDFVTIVAPRDSFEKAAGIAVADGAKFEPVYAKAEWSANNTTSRLGDELAPTGDAAAWFVGDEYCFGPPPGALSGVTLPTVQYGDKATLSTKLVDEAGAAVVGQPVRFKVGTAPAVSGTTDAAGVAKAVFPATLTAGTYPVTVEFAGSDTVGKAKATGSLVVKSEVTKFAALKVAKPTATSRVVTATLKDDDGKAVAGQKVAWYVNGKKVATLTTTSTGATVYKGAKPGQTVQAKFVAVSGKYLASSSNSAKV